jgi:hypothetical protein
LWFACRRPNSSRALINRLRLLVFSACVFCAQGGIARAQNAAEPLPGRYEVAAGVTWSGPAAFGSRDASLTTAAGTRYRLFSASTELAGAPALDVRLGLRLTRLVQAEIVAAYSSPVLATSVSNDAETGAATVASESIRQITIVGAIVVALPRWRVGSRILPFVTGGGGYLRQLHQGETLAETGLIYHVGGGATIPMGSRARPRGVKQFGIRTDVRALITTGGVALDGGTHASPAVAVSVFARY